MAKNDQPPFTPEQARALSRRPPKSGGGTNEAGRSQGSMGSAKANKQAFKPGLRTGVKKGAG